MSVMPKVTLYRTWDDITHDTLNDATKHLEKSYGLRINLIASKLVDLDYFGAIQILDNNFVHLRAIVKIKEDLDWINNNGA